MTEDRPKIALAGGITGLPDHNKPAFHAAARNLMAAGWDVLNPADTAGGRVDLPKAVYMLQSIRNVLDAGALYTLAGWEFSEGARLEYAVARICAKRWYDEILSVPKLPSPRNKPLPWKMNPLERVAGIVYGDRNRGYGHPVDDFARQVQLIEAATGNRLSRRDIAKLGISFKLSRDFQQPKDDNALDIMGYALTMLMVKYRGGAYTETGP